MVKRNESIGSFEQSHAKNIASIPTASMGLSDCSVVDRERQTAEYDWLCSEFYAGSLTGGEGSLCMGIVFSKAVLDQRRKPTEAFWNQSPRISTISRFCEDLHVH